MSEGDLLPEVFLSFAGRFSDSRLVLLLHLPIPGNLKKSKYSRCRFDEQWFNWQNLSPITAVGPFRNLTGFPFISPKGNLQNFAA